jgi:hypothetical protein
MTDPIPDPTHPDFRDGDDVLAPTPAGDGSGDVGDIGPDGAPGPAPDPGEAAEADAP